MFLFIDTMHSIGHILKSHTLKLLLIVCLLFQTGCGLKFKKKSESITAAQPEINTTSRQISNKERKDLVKSGNAFSIEDIQQITSYYSDKANARIKQDMMSHTKLTSKQRNKLMVNEIISRDVQIIPLPLNLERTLTSLPLNVLRVHAGSRVMLINVKSRKILDIIKI